MDEIWKPVLGYEGRYEVSDMGQVRSLPIVVNGFGRTFVHPGSNRILKQTSGHFGYCTVSLRDGRRGNRKRVHTIVCEAFHGPRPQGRFALHRDGDSRNNRAGNLYWGTAQQNADDMIRHGSRQMGQAHSQAKLTDDEVEELRARLASSELNAKQAAAEYKISLRHVYALKSRAFRRPSPPTRSALSHSPLPS